MPESSAGVERLKKNWRLQCLICRNSRKETPHSFIRCTKERYGGGLVYYGSDVFTGVITCDKFDPMQDPFKKVEK